MPDESQKYETPEAFERALITRLKNSARASGTTLEKLLNKVIFDRFLARVFHNGKDNLVVKGAYSLELRYKDTGIARTTKDIDFMLKELKGITENEMWGLLKEISQIDLNDWFSFEVLAPQQELTLATYGGLRFPVIAKIGKKEFKRFKIDVVIADSFNSEPDWVTGNELLGFAGIDAPTIALIPLAKQFAEKIHTYSNPVIENNSRVRDLVDMVIYIDHGLPDKETLKKEIANTFRIRKTHDIPKVLLSPPANWKEPYVRLASDWGASKKNIDEAFDYLNSFWKDLYSVT